MKETHPTTNERVISKTHQKISSPEHETLTKHIKKTINYGK